MPVLPSVPHARTRATLKLADRRGISRPFLGHLRRKVERGKRSAFGVFGAV